MIRRIALTAFAIFAISVPTFAVDPIVNTWQMEGTQHTKVKQTGNPNLDNDAPFSATFVFEQAQHKFDDGTRVGKWQKLNGKYSVDLKKAEQQEQNDLGSGFKVKKFKYSKGKLNASHDVLTINKNAKLKQKNNGITIVEIFTAALISH